MTCRVVLDVMYKSRTVHVNYFDINCQSIWRRQFIPMQGPFGWQRNAGREYHVTPTEYPEYPEYRISRISRDTHLIHVV